MVSAGRHARRGRLVRVGSVCVPMGSPSTPTPTAGAVGRLVPTGGCVPMGLVLALRARSIATTNAARSRPMAVTAGRAGSCVLPIRPAPMASACAPMAKNSIPMTTVGPAVRAVRMDASVPTEHVLALRARSTAATNAARLRPMAVTAGRAGSCVLPIRPAPMASACATTV